ncbi:MAG: STAS domain-containing protein [Marmoricola sp.]
MASSTPKQGSHGGVAMRLTITRSMPAGVGGSCTLQVLGCIDLSNRQQLVDAATEAVFIADAVVFDASGVEFIDACGIAALIEIGQIAEREATKFCIGPRSPQLDRVLDLLVMSDWWA